MTPGNPGTATAAPGGCRRRRLGLWSGQRRRIAAPPERTGEAGGGYRAGVIRPVTSPNPMSAPPGPGRWRVIGDGVPVLQELVPAGSSCSGSLPPQVSSSSEPRWSRFGAADRAGGEQVAGAQGGAVDGHVGEHLGRRPVHARRTAGGRRSRRSARTSSARSRPHGSLGVVQVGQRRGSAGRRRDPGRVQRRQRDDPRRDRGGEGLAQERAERHVLPGLDVAGAPVVDQARRRRRGRRSRPAAPARAGSTRRRRRSRPRPRCPAGATGRTSDRVVGALRWPVRPRRSGCRRRRRCRPGRGSRSAGASSWASAAPGRAGTSGPRLVAWCSRGVEVDVVGDLERQVQPHLRPAGCRCGSTAAAAVG